MKRLLLVLILCTLPAATTAQTPVGIVGTGTNSNRQMYVVYDTGDIYIYSATANQWSFLTSVPGATQATTYTDRSAILVVIDGTNVYVVHPGGTVIESGSIATFGKEIVEVVIPAGNIGNTTAFVRYDDGSFGFGFISSGGWSNFTNPLLSPVITESTTWGRIKNDHKDGGQ